MGTRAYQTNKTHTITVKPGEAIVSIVFPVAIATSISHQLMRGRTEALAEEAALTAAPTDANLAAALARMESLAAMFGRAIAEADILGRNAAQARGIELPGVAAKEVH